MNLFYNSIF